MWYNRYARLRLSASARRHLELVRDHCDPHEIGRKSDLERSVAAKTQDVESGSHPRVQPVGRQGQ